MLVRGTTILNKVSGKAHCGGDIWAKTEAGEAGSLADIWGKSKWKSAAGGSLRAPRISDWGVGEGELYRCRVGSYFYISKFLYFCILVYSLSRMENCWRVVFLSYCCHNKLPQIYWLKQYTFVSYSSIDQQSNTSRTRLEIRSIRILALLAGLHSLLETKRGAVSLLIGLLIAFSPCSCRTEVPFSLLWFVVPSSIFKASTGGSSPHHTFL